MSYLTNNSDINLNEEYKGPVSTGESGKDMPWQLSYSKQYVCHHKNG
jgi:hypothetical protein